MTRGKSMAQEWTGALWRRPEPEPVADLVIDFGGDYRLVDMFVLSGSVPAEFHWGRTHGPLQPLSRPRIDLSVRGERVELETAGSDSAPLSLPWDGSAHAFENIASAVTSLAYAANGQLRMNPRIVAAHFVDSLNVVFGSLGLSPNAYQLGAYRNIVEGDDEASPPNIQVVLRELDRRRPDWRNDPEVRSRLVTALRSRLAGANESANSNAQELLSDALGSPVPEIRRLWGQ